MWLIVEQQQKTLFLFTWLLKDSSSVWIWPSFFSTQCTPFSSDCKTTEVKFCFSNILTFRCPTTLWVPLWGEALRGQNSVFRRGLWWNVCTGITRGESHCHPLVLLETHVPTTSEVQDPCACILPPIGCYPGQVYISGTWRGKGGGLFFLLLQQAPPFLQSESSGSCQSLRTLPLTGPSWEARVFHGRDLTGKWNLCLAVRVTSHTISLEVTLTN